MSMLFFALFLIFFSIFAVIVFPIACIFDLAKNTQLSPSRKTGWMVASIFLFPISPIIYAAIVSPRKGMRILGYLTGLGILVIGIWVYDYTSKITKDMNEKVNKLKVMNVTFDSTLPESASDRLSQELSALSERVSEYSFGSDSKEISNDQKRLEELSEAMSDSQVSAEEFYKLFPNDAK